MDSAASKSASSGFVLPDFERGCDPGRLMVTASLRAASCECLRDRKGGGGDFGGSFSLRFPPPLKKFPGRKRGRPEEEEEDDLEDDDEEDPSLFCC